MTQGVRVRAGRLDEELMKFCPDPRILARRKLLSR